MIISELGRAGQRPGAECTTKKGALSVGNGRGFPPPDGGGSNGARCSSRDRKVAVTFPTLARATPGNATGGFRRQLEQRLSFAGRAASAGARCRSVSAPQVHDAVGQAVGRRIRRRVEPDETLEPPKPFHLGPCELARV